MGKHWLESCRMVVLNLILLRLGFSCIQMDRQLSGEFLQPGFKSEVHVVALPSHCVEVYRHLRRLAPDPSTHRLMVMDTEGLHDWQDYLLGLGIQSLVLRWGTTGSCRQLARAGWNLP